MKAGVATSETLVGKVMVDGGLVSTSANQQRARGFGGYAGALFRIRVPKGARAAWVNDHPSSPRLHKSEILLPRSTRFKVTGVEHQPSGFWLIDIDVIG